MAETLVFPSMVMADGQAHLADIKAVSSSYPLRGKLGERAPGELGQEVAAPCARHGLARRTPECGAECQRRYGGDGR